jgi:hypothetical protein
MNIGSVRLVIWLIAAVSSLVVATVSSLVVAAVASLVVAPVVTSAANCGALATPWVVALNLSVIDDNDFRLLLSVHTSVLHVGLSSLGSRFCHGDAEQHTAEENRNPHHTVPEPPKGNIAAAVVVGIVAICAAKFCVRVVAVFASHLIIITS